MSREEKFSFARLPLGRDKTLVYTSPFLMGHHYGAFNKSNDDAAKKKKKKKKILLRWDVCTLSDYIFLSIFFPPPFNFIF
jgi:hypothetical protein